MRGALLDELRGRDWASRSVRARARGLKSAQDDLTNRLGRTPTPAEIAAELDLPQDDVKKLVDDVHRATVLHYDSLVLEGDAESFLANSDDSPEDVILDRERKGYLAAAVQALPDRLRHVVVGYFFEERSMQDLADELGVSESRVSQLRAEAMVLLRDGINAQLDPDLVSPEARPNGRVARRKASYYATVAAMSDHGTRVSERPVEATPVVSQRAAAGA
jgi:RNA polymerase sigma factor for flagellar operon FliA